jgi:chromosome segregation ATPase
MADSSLNELQGKLAELGTNLTAIMEAQKELLGLKDQFKDIDVAAKENTLLVNSYEARIKELENKINLHQREVDDIWKGMDALANPLG